MIWENMECSHYQCSNAEKNEDTGDLICKATGYCCGYAPSDPRKIKSPCLFDEIFASNAQIKRMLAMIRAVKVGSKVIVPYKRRYGWYTREVIDSSLGTVLTIDKFGHMEIDVHAWKGTWKYRLEDFTRTIFLSRSELEENMEEKLEIMQEELDEQERIRAERREEDGRESEE